MNHNNLQMSIGQSTKKTPTAPKQISKKIIYQSIVKIHELYLIFQPSFKNEWGSQEAEEQQRKILETDTTVELK